MISWNKKKLPTAKRKGRKTLVNTQTLVRTMQRYCFYLDMQIFWRDFGEIWRNKAQNDIYRLISSNT